MKKRLKKKMAKNYMNEVKSEIMLSTLLKEDKARIDALKHHYSLLLKNFKNKKFYYKCKGDK